MAASADNGFKQKAAIEFVMKECVAARETSDRLKNVQVKRPLSYPSVR